MKRKSTIYKEICKLNEEYCQDFNMGISDRYLRIVIDKIIELAREK